MMQSTENLYPNVIRRRQSRARPFATVANINGQCQDLGFADLERASNRAAWFLDEKLPDHVKFLYMGPSDIRYLIWVLAAMKTGKCVILPSPGNVVTANRRFFQTVNAKVLLYAPEATEMLSPLISGTQDIVMPIASPDYETLLSEDEVPAYAFDKTFDEVKDVPFLGAHTSGTSGHPRPVYWNHLAAAALAGPYDPSIQATYQGSKNLTLELVEGQTILIPFPLFHLGGLGALLSGIHWDFTVVLPSRGTPLSPQNFTSLLKVGKCTAACAPPSLLESMLSYPPGLEALSQLVHVAYTGGPLNPTRGEKLAQHISHLAPLFGSTEGGPAHLVCTDNSAHWNAYKFIDAGQRMEEVAPGFYELVFPKTDVVNGMYAFFHTCPHLDEYRTSDLFSPVEGEDGWWIYRGRVDNWIAMSNGLKFDPTELENKISASPDVSGVLVAGSHRFRLCLLVELKEAAIDPRAKETALENLWPVVSEANKQAPRFGRVPKELVIFTTKDKPFLRAGKCTIQRRLTLSAYSQEIDEQYARVEDGLFTSGLPFLRSTEPQDLVPLLVDLYKQTVDSEDVEIGVDDDLFSHGLDSLGAFVVSARLKAALRSHGVDDEKLKSIDTKLLYAAATIAQMADKISSTLSETGTSNGLVSSTGYVHQKTLLNKYETELRNFALNGSARSNGETIILTGSTGSLGSYILSTLLARPDVKKVFCLNRSPKGRERQTTSLQARGLPALSSNDERVTFLQVQLSEPKLGLSDAEYSILLRDTTSIIHNAFPVNFLLSLLSFEPQIQSLVNLLKLAGEGFNCPTVLFISSIAAALPATGSRQIVPEAVLRPDEANDLLQQGYAQAKHICERLLETYVATFNGSRKAAVLRVGQICGPTSGKGAWNPQEWLPSLVLSSKFLGAAPDSIGNAEIDWVPIDLLSSIISELLTASFSRDGKDLAVYNVVNPSTTPWGELLPALTRVVPATVPAHEWISRLESSGKDHHLPGENPALKLIDFYRGVMLSNNTAPKIETGNLARDSKTAGKPTPVRPEHMARWMQAWGI